jgi:hypothetical protein
MQKSEYQTPLLLNICNRTLHFLASISRKYAVLKLQPALVYIFLEVDRSNQPTILLINSANSGSMVSWLDGSEQPNGE